MKSTKFVLFALVLVVGCGNPPPKPSTTTIEVGPPPVAGSVTLGKSDEALPAFSVASSEYPSWSTLMVADKAGIINGKQGGKHGPLETKWGVDLVLEVKDYDTCLGQYGNSACDAVCITNVDSLNPALGRPSTAVCPTSTSVGGDKVIAVGISDIADLKGVKVYGLAKSVSQYLYVRVLQKRGLSLEEFPFESLDPAAAATALQSGAGDIKAINVWNPFALQTLRTNPDAKVVFTSEEIPEEIIDMILMGNDSLKKEGGENFAALLCDTFYAVCDKLNDTNSEIADATLTALGEDFSKLPLEDMKIVVKDTRFYDTTAKGKALFSSDKFKETMEKVVVPTCQTIEIVENGKSPPTIGYNDDSKQLNFSTKYMDLAKSK